MTRARSLTPALRAFVAAGLVATLSASLTACGSPEDKAAGHVAEAQKYLAADDYKRATLEAKNAVQLQPKNAEAHLILAKAAWRNGDYREAYPHLQMAVEGDPSLVEARLRLADLNLAGGDLKGATDQLDALRKLAPDTAEVHLLAGRLLIAQDKNDEGAKEIDAALAANPALVDALNIKASLLSGQGKNVEALAVLDGGLAKAKGADADTLRDYRLKFLYATGQFPAYESGLKALIGQFPDRLAFRYQLLDFYTLQQRTDDEERTLRELLVADPKNEQNEARLARLLITLGKAEEAEKLLLDSTARSPDSAELKLALGDFYRFRKRSKEAMETYKSVADRWADTTAEGQKARNRIVAQYALDGDIKAARAGIDAILKAAPDNADALLSRATFAFLDRKYEDAIADLRTVLRREKSAEALLLLARSYVGIGDNVVAKDTYRRLVEDYPGNADGVKELAVLLSAQGDAAAAGEILRRFVAIRPGDTEASAALVQTLLAQRDLTGAEAEARRMAASGAGGVGAEQQVGAVLAAQGDREAALARYKAVLEKDPKQFQALEGYVDLQLQANRPSEAIAFLERYPKGDLAPSLLLGKVYARQGDIASARQAVDAAIAANPTDGRPYLALATLVAEQSPEQFAVLQRGWKASGGDPALGLFLASSYEQQGKPEDAIRIYEDIVRQDRASPAVLNNLASLLLDHRTDKASLARALELAKRLGAPTDAIALDTIGWAYFRNGDYPAALRPLERAVAADGSNPTLQYHLGKAYAAGSNPVSARQHLNRALELGGDKASFAADARLTLGKLGS